MGRKKNQWHPGFAAAIRMELKDNKDDLIFEEEYLLSKKPLQMDMLIVKKIRMWRLRTESVRYLGGII